MIATAVEWTTLCIQRLMVPDALIPYVVRAQWNTERVDGKRCQVCAADHAPHHGRCARAARWRDFWCGLNDREFAAVVRLVGHEHIDRVWQCQHRSLVSRTIPEEFQFWYLWVAPYLIGVEVITVVRASIRLDGKQPAEALVPDVVTADRYGMFIQQEALICADGRRR